MGSAVDGIHPSDEELVARVGRQDQHAFDELYTRYADLVYSVALRVLADPGLAQDVAQEVFVRFWRSPGRYDAGRGRFGNWLMSVTRNRAVDEVRMRGRRRLREVAPSVLADDPPDGLAEDPLLNAQLEADRSAVRRALRELPSEQRTALELAYFGGLTQQEIAELLDQPLGTVKTRTRLAMKKLRLALAGEVGIGG
jgi:RNA polymerase sigma-70 factor, ECF subfamily